MLIPPPKLLNKEENSEKFQCNTIEKMRDVSYSLSVQEKLPPK